METYAPFLVLGLTLGVFIARQTPETVVALLIGMLFCIASVIVPRLCPLEKPTKLEAHMKELEAKIAEMDKIMQANAEFSAKEFGTLKNVLQIKQMGR